MSTLRLESAAAATAGLLVDNHTDIIGSATNAINNNSIYYVNGNMAFGDNNEGGHFFTVTHQNVSESNMTGNGSMGPVWTPPIYITIWITITYVLVFLVGVIGNLLVIVVVLFVREMKTSTNLCLMNLSIADLLVLLICQPSSLLEHYANEKWLLGEALCKIVFYLENLVTLVSILIIITVSLERFWAVYYPLKTYSSGSKSKAVISMVLVWVIAIATSIPFLLMAKTHSRYHTLDKEIVDVCESTIELPWHKGYVVCRFIFTFAIPLILLVFLYTMIIIKVINKPMECKQMTETARAQAQQNRRQLVVMLVGIIVLFFVCLLPFRIFAIWSIFSPVSPFESVSAETYVNAISFTRLLLYINSAGNPIIYNLVSTKFRRAFQRVLRMYCSCCPLGKLGNGVNANGTYSHATRMTTMSHYSVVKQSANDFSDNVDAV